MPRTASGKASPETLEAASKAPPTRRTPSVIPRIKATRKEKTAGVVAVMKSHVTEAIAANGGAKSKAIVPKSKTMTRRDSEKPCEFFGLKFCFHAPPFIKQKAALFASASTRKVSEYTLQ